MDAQPPATILTVDDDVDTSLAVAELLQFEGYRVENVRSGLEAIHRLKRQMFQAVLLDIGLPDRDGFAVMEEMLAFDPHLPIIVLTAHHGLEQRVGPLDLQGAFAYLTKPYNCEELKSTVRRAIHVKSLATRAERVQVALSASEDRFQSVAQSANDAIIVCDETGNIVSWNHAAEVMFGYREEEIVGKPLVLIMPPRYRIPHQKGLQRIRRTGETMVTGQTLELEGLRKDGREFPLELSLGMWSTGSGKYFCGIIRDITRRKHAEARLQESEARLRHLVNHSHDPIVLLDVDGNRLLEVNVRAGEFFEYSCQELLSLPLTEVFPHSAPCLHALMTSAPNAEERISDPLIGVTKSGRQIPVELAVSVIQVDGRSSLIALIRDLGNPDAPEKRGLDREPHVLWLLSRVPTPVLTVDRRRMVSFANQAARELWGTSEASLLGQPISTLLGLTEARWNTMVAEVNSCEGEGAGSPHEWDSQDRQRVYRYRLFSCADFSRRTEEIGLLFWDITHERELQDQFILIEKLSTLGTMVSGMAHEISNPLQAVLGLSELLADEQDPSVMRQWARDLKRVSRQAIAVLKNVTTYARPSARDQVTSLDLNECVQEAADLVRHSPYFGEVAILRDLQPVPYVCARKSEIDQVLVNLMGNAVQAMKGRGQLTLTTGADDTTVTVQIADTGPGIPTALHHTIFDPFFTTKAEGKGTGLGLHIVKEIVTKYGGTIQVESPPGTGATFLLHFPVGAC